MQPFAISAFTDPPFLVMEGGPLETQNVQKWMFLIIVVPSLNRGALAGQSPSWAEETTHSVKGPIHKVKFTPRMHMLKSQVHSCGDRNRTQVFTGQSV